MWKMSLATSPRPASFAPLLYAGRVADCIAVASEQGYQGVEISLRAADELSIVELRKGLDTRGLALSAVGSGRVFLEDKLSFSDPDGDVRRRAVERIKEHVRFAAQFGAGVIIGLVRGARPTSSDGATEMALIVECLQECAEYAAARQTGLLVEPINRYETSFVNTAEDAVRVLERVGFQNVGVLLDVFHMNIEEVKIGDAIRTAGKWLAYFHVVDSNRRAPGWGHVDYGEIVAALKDIGYQGWISAEVLPLPDSFAAARQARSFMQDLEVALRR